MRLILSVIFLEMLFSVYYFRQLDAVTVDWKTRFNTNRHYPYQLLIQLTCSIMNTLHWTNVGVVKYFWTTNLGIVCTFEIITKDWRFVWCPPQIPVNQNYRKVIICFVVKLWDVKFRFCLEFYLRRGVSVLIKPLFNLWIVIGKQTNQIMKHVSHHC